MNAKILDAVCIAVLCVILTLGLWPFHSPQNGVTWLKNRNGLGFSGRGTVIGSTPVDTATSQAGASLEIWLVPGRVPDSSTFLSFFTPEDRFRFSLHQSVSDLCLQTSIRNGPDAAKKAKIYVDDVFRKARPMFISIASGAGGTAVYIEGALARRAPKLRLTANWFTGRMVLGDSPGQTDSWTGNLLGFAIYNRELTPPQLRKHYDTWTRAGRPAIQADEENLALYLFDERAGNVVHNRVHSGADLSIPETYVVLDKILLEPFWTEFGFTESYWTAAFKNVIGFIPLGFCFCARLSVARRVRPVALTTVLLGALVSLTIEILQAYLPTRDSGMTDIFTNTLGTWIGVLAFRSKPAQALFEALGHWNQALAADSRGD